MATYIFLNINYYILFNRTPIVRYLGIFSAYYDKQTVIFLKKRCSQIPFLLLIFERMFFKWYYFEIICLRAAYLAKTCLRFLVDDLVS